MSLKHAGLGTLVGLLVGATRDKDLGESRAGSTLRSGATGVATDLGVYGGAQLGKHLSGLVGIRRILQANRPLARELSRQPVGSRLKALLSGPAIREGMLSGSTLPGLKGKLHALAPVLGAVAGGAGAYQVAKREDKTPLGRLRETFKLGGQKQAGLKLALSINRDDGLGVVVARLQDGLKQARAKRLGQKTAALSALGAGYGAVRPRDPGESRRDAVLHGAGVGLAGDLGAGVGAGIGYAAASPLKALLSRIGRVKPVGPAPAGAPRIQAPQAHPLLSHAGPAIPGKPTPSSLVGRIRRLGHGAGVGGAVLGATLGGVLGIAASRREPKPTRRKITIPGTAASY